MTTTASCWTGVPSRMPQNRHADALFCLRMRIFNIVANVSYMTRCQSLLLRHCGHNHCLHLKGRTTEQSICPVAEQSPAMLVTAKHACAQALQQSSQQHAEHATVACRLPASRRHCMLLGQHPCTGRVGDSSAVQGVARHNAAGRNALACELAPPPHLHPVMRPQQHVELSCMICTSLMLRWLPGLPDKQEVGFVVMLHASL